jgi:acetate kinase
MGISSEYSTIQGHVIPVDEEVIIARDTLRCIRKEVV